MAIKIRFFASLAETVGRRETELAYADQLTVASVGVGTAPRSLLQNITAHEQSYG